MNLRRIYLAVLLVMLFVCRGDSASLIAPAGEGLFRIHSAEPLGRRHFRFRFLSETGTLELKGVEPGGLYTAKFGFSYGVLRWLDFSAALPVKFDSAVGLLKYGTGDPMVAIKFARPSQFPSLMYVALQTTVSLPLGYKGRHALDALGELRPYSTDGTDIAIQGLMDINYLPVSVYLNAGYVIAGAPEFSEVLYGGGVEVGKGKSIALTAEYETSVLVNENNVTSNGSLGIRLSFIRGVEFEAGLRRDFFEDGPNYTGIVGLRIHGTRGGDKLLRSRSEMYRIKKPTRQEILTEFKPEGITRVAVVNFSGFESSQAGEKIAQSIRDALSPYNHIKVVDISRYQDAPHISFLDLDDALQLAQMVDADIVITGRVSRQELDRSAGLYVPFVLRLPRTAAIVEAHVRIMERKAGALAMTTTVKGRSSSGRGIRMLPVGAEDRTEYLRIDKREQLKDEAIGSLVMHLIEEMSAQFPWLPLPRLAKSETLSSP